MILREKIIEKIKTYCNDDRFLAKFAEDELSCSDCIADVKKSIGYSFACDPVGRCGKRCRDVVLEHLNDEVEE